MDKVAVVIPTYRAKQSILDVLARIGREVSTIYVVDDACPQRSGAHVQSNCSDPRVKVCVLEKNLGVGGATLYGLNAASADGHSIAVKIDSDGQMDPALIPVFIAPILNKRADYVKGNRFYSLGALHSMPVVRKIGNAGLSFLLKACSGYWQVMDPTNGFFALQLSLLPHIEPQKISQRYFFESDLLFRLGIARACVVDVPMNAKYGPEESGLGVGHSLLTFPGKIFLRMGKRIFYSYFLRDFGLVSILLLSAVTMALFSICFGGYHWYLSNSTGVLTSSGTVMIAAIPLILSFQMMIFALLFDVLNVPKEPIHPMLSGSSPVSHSKESFYDS